TIALIEEEQTTDIMYHPFEAGKSLFIENFHQENLFHKVVEKGKVIAPSLSLKEIAGYVSKRLSLLPAEYKRFENPHRYKIGVSKRLLNLRDELRQHYKRL